MNIVSGNLITLAKDGRFDVIVHGCNCFCQMGAGIAKSIKAEFPEAYESDNATSKGDRSKMGTISAAAISVNQRKLTVVNGYTQFDWRGSGVKACYDSIRSVFKIIKRDYSGKRIGYPKIGAGLGGGDWERISQIIDQELEGEDHTLVELK